jgi:hypothetical protein
MQMTMEWEATRNLKAGELLSKAWSFQITTLFWSGLGVYAVG